MSIGRTISDHHDAGKLRSYRPEATRKPARRRAYLTEKAATQFDDPNSAVNLLCGRGYIAAALSRWVLGELIYGDRKRGRFLVMLHPPPSDVWEIRVTEPVVQVRLLGRFATQDTFIVMGMYTRGALGRKGSAAWAAAMEDCVRQWDALFPDEPPLTGRTIHDFVSENCNEFPLVNSGAPDGPRPRRLRGGSTA